MSGDKIAMKSLRAWEKRALSLTQKAEALLADMMEGVGPDASVMGENLTGLASEVQAAAEILFDVLNTEISNRRES